MSYYQITTSLKTNSCLVQHVTLQAVKCTQLDCAFTNSKAWLLLQLYYCKFVDEIFASFFTSSSVNSLCCEFCVYSRKKLQFPQCPSARNASFQSHPGRITVASATCKRSKLNRLCHVCHLNPSWWMSFLWSRCVLKMDHHCRILLTSPTNTHKKAPPYCLYGTELAPSLVEQLCGTFQPSLLLLLLHVHDAGLHLLQCQEQGLISGRLQCHRGEDGYTCINTAGTTKHVRFSIFIGRNAL